MIKHALSLTITIVTLASLAACGGGKKTITVDDSADYKGATSLQPLKRPSLPSSEPIASEPIVSEPIASEPVVSAEVVPVKEAPIINPVDTIAIEKELDVDLQDETNVESLNVPAAEVETGISSEIVNVDNGEQRLLIGAGFDEAWGYLNENIKTSDLTVFSRNKVAGRFAIGCGNINAESKNKKTGWSFFNREKLEQLEYCALELVEKRGKTWVTVLNRSGLAVQSEYSGPVFERIFND